MSSMQTWPDVFARIYERLHHGSFLPHPRCSIARMDQLLDDSKLAIKYQKGSRFGDKFPGQAQLGNDVRIRVTKTFVGHALENEHRDAPLVLFATGSGIGSVLAIFQHRLHHNKSSTVTQPLAISLFVGSKEEDYEMVHDLLADFRLATLLDVCEIVQSNATKERAQERMMLNENRAALLNKLQNPRCVVFVCRNQQATHGAKGWLSELLGSDVQHELSSIVRDSLKNASQHEYIRT